MKRIATISTALLAFSLSLVLVSPGSSWARNPGHRSARPSVTARPNVNAARKTTTLPMNPMAFWTSMAQITTAYQKGMIRAANRYSSLNRIGARSTANAQLSNDAHSAYLGANSKFWQTAAKTTPWGAMIKASAAPFYAPFGGLRVPTPVQYWTTVMDSLKSSSRASSSAGQRGGSARR